MVGVSHRPSRMRGLRLPASALTGPSALTRTRYASSYPVTMMWVRQQEGSGAVTVAIVVQVSEGLVLATDSAMAVQGELAIPGKAPQTGLLKVYNSATKIVQLRDWPLGIVTFGLGQIRNRTIESHVQEFADGQPPEQPTSIVQVAQDLHAFIEARLGALAP